MFRQTVWDMKDSNKVKQFQHTMTTYLPLEKRAGNAAIPLEGGVGIRDDIILHESGKAISIHHEWRSHKW